MKNNLLAMYREADQVQAAWAKASAELGHPVSCKRGCSHCCNISVLALGEETDLIARRLLPHWEQYLPGLLANALRYGDGSSHDLVKFHKEQKPCAMLTDDGECSVYDIRPSNCRYYEVISKPELCASTEEGIMISVLGTQFLLEEFILNEIRKVDKMIGPLPLLVLVCLGRLLPGEKAIQEALAQLPDHAIWFERYRKHAGLFF